MDRRRLAAVVFATALCAAGCRAGDRAPRAASTSEHVTSQSGEAALRPKALLARADSASARFAFDMALADYQRVVSSAEGGRDSVMLARALTGVGLAAWHRGDFDAAVQAQQRALTLKLRLGLTRELAKSLNGLGLVANDRGELDAAVQRFTEARAAAEAVHDSAYIVKARGNLGLAYQHMGDFDRARIEMFAQRDGAAAIGDTVVETNALNNLGMLETRVGNPVAALQWLTQSRARYATLEDPVGEENSLGQLAVAYEELGQPGRALAYFDSALAVASANGLREPEADDLELQAELYEDLGNHARSLELLRRARALSDSLDMKQKLGHVALAEARTYASLGNGTLAISRSREAARYASTAGARPEHLEAQLYLAELAQRGDDAPAARSALGAARATAASIGIASARITYALGAARVADIAQRPGDVLAALDANVADTLLLTAGEHATAEALRARAYSRQRRYDLAVAAGRRAVRSIERIRGSLTPGALRTSFTAARVQAYADLVVALLTTGHPDEAFHVAEEARGRGLLEQLGLAARGLSRGAGRDLAVADSLLRRIDMLIQRLRISDSLRSGRPNRSLDRATGSAARELADARHEYEALMDRVPLADPDAGILGIGPRVAGAVRRSLAPGEALIEYLAGDDRLLIFVLTRDHMRWLDQPIGSAELAERVRLIRTLIAARDPAADAPLRELDARIVAPIERAGMLSGVRTLVVVPHGALTYLPFAALRSGAEENQPPRYLAERYAILTVPSASAFSVMRGRAAQRVAGMATVFAPLPAELPSTRDEAGAVAGELADARLTIGAQATEPVVRDALLRAPIVHIASHGTLDAQSPMFSSVQLAAPTERDGARASADDGRLETHEVLGLTVRSSLVFLSGCETALGGSSSTTYSRRDDYATLAQAFLFAGARNVVATLWRIDDRAAAVLASRFYADLESSSPSDALANAQRALIRDPKYSSPYYWAAYTLSGSGRLD